ncbi:hypothetical protein CTZ24_05255 [Pantoea phytobeneficialis]|uniref:Uncharacterized protein n=1 Tax=Pantoea phytobeneficialis TaxID=2052056 RepID=A0AAP9KNI3_9GAMM|nr:hypothetical protein CTZ24_05255 [Pantoea phytobeneficialis]
MGHMWGKKYQSSLFELISPTPHLYIYAKRGRIIKPIINNRLQKNQKMKWGNGETPAKWGLSGGSFGFLPLKQTSLKTNV